LLRDEAELRRGGNYEAAFFVMMPTIIGPKGKKNIATA